MNRLLVFLLLLLSTVLWSQEKKDSVTLKWGKVPGASGYLIEVQNDKKQIVLRQKVTSNEYSVNLPEGKYRHRIGVLNKFGTLTAFSQWEPFRIIHPVPPELELDSVLFYARKDGKQKVRLEGKHFTEEMEILIHGEDSDLPVLEKAFERPEVVEFTIDVTDAPIGLYSLELINPLQKKIQRSPFLSIAETKEQAKKIAAREKIEDTKEEGTSSQARIESDKIKPQKTELWDVLWRSAILPGWGHYYMGDTQKGIIYSATFWTSFIVYAGLYNQANNSISSYYGINNRNQLLFTGLTPATQYYGFSQYNAENKAYNQARTLTNEVEVAAIVTGAIYLTNLLDAYFTWKNISVDTPAGSKTAQIHPFFHATRYTKQNWNFRTNTEYSLGMQIRW